MVVFPSQISGLLIVHMITHMPVIVGIAFVFAVTLTVSANLSDSYAHLMSNFEVFPGHLSPYTLSHELGQSSYFEADSVLQ